MTFWQWFVRKLEKIGNPDWGLFKESSVFTLSFPVVLLNRWWVELGRIGWQRLFVELVRWQLRFCTAQKVALSSLPASLSAHPRATRMQKRAALAPLSPWRDEGVARGRGVWMLQSVQWRDEERFQFGLSVKLNHFVDDIKTAHFNCTISIKPIG